MARRLSSGTLDRDFVTIYFLQGEQKQSFSIRRTRLVLGVIIAVFLAVALRVWQQMQVVKIGYCTSQYRQQYQALVDEQRSLLSQRNALASLGRIETIARRNLGLAEPGSGQLVFLVDPAQQPEGLPGWRSFPGILKQWFRKAWGHTRGKYSEA